MTKPSLTRVQYVEKVNELMRQHQAYTREMVVHFHPRGVAPDQASGLYVEGPHEARAIWAWADAKIAAEYDFEELPPV
ncbi:hypothetical protein [Cupriavidus plantarum]|uniref:hypothetical protein n=1 Tax=Cupriavidus plantarum TaxID=942865 RepID=UPI00339D84FC